MIWISNANCTLSLSTSSGNTVQQASALSDLAWIKVQTAKLYAEVYKSNSEYAEARSIHVQILHKYSANKDPWEHAYALLNIAKIDVAIGAYKDDVQRSIDTAKSIFNAQNYSTGVRCCDTILGELNLRDGNFLLAKTIFQRCLTLSWGQESDIVTYRLERLANVSRWGGMHSSVTWTTLFLVYVLKSKQKLEVHKALKFVGDVLLAQGDQDTAISLFTVALEGLTQMDVHCS
ncbi:hypothetical protein DFH09DRAFT_1079841 [Mycena vulgaris]|nr:hypothetical protein DFH09DRAFT_1079841 [Mycena vulgaris]